MSLAHPKYRPDIDGLRAIAVLSVVVFHAYPGWASGGYIGVDVFFVISGYLITTILFESLDRGSFSFVAFYARRIMRIFPALLVVLAACGIAGWFELFADEYRHLGKHVAAGAGFVSNLVLWQEAGYFDPAADTKPLLHLWSLGIEEQFYIVWPLLLWGAWKLKLSLPAITLVVALASFFLNVAGIEGNAVATFYSPLTRVWELLCGSLLAWASLQKTGRLASHGEQSDGRSGRDLLSIAGAALFAVGLLRIDKDTLFPGLWAIVPVCGAAALIYAGPFALVNRTILSSRILVWFGLISFPLYLWHWPLLSFARISEGTVPSAGLRTAAVALSIVLAWLTYRLIEHPIRSGDASGAKGLALAGLMLLVGGAGYATYAGDGWQDRPVNAERDVSQAANALPASRPCLRAHPNAWPCYESKREHADTILLVGDSHMQSLALGLISLFDQGNLKYNVTAIGRPGCNPFTDTESLGRDGRRFGCVEAISTALDSARGRADVKWVVLVGRHASRFHGNAFGKIANESERMNYRYRGRDVPPEEAFSLGLEQTLAMFSGSGKRILFVHQVPELGFDPRRCRGTHSDCSVGLPEVRDRLGPYRAAVKRLVADRVRVMEYDPLKLICDDTRCRAINPKGELLYRDDNHISPVASLYLAREIAALIERER